MVTLALIGKGAWGKNFAGAAEKIAGVQITGIFDSSMPLNVENVNGIIIATPASTHFGIARKFLADGRNLLIEKPLCTSRKEAEELAQLATRSDAKVLVGHLWLYNPAYRAARNAMLQIGNVQSISFKGIGSLPRKDVSVLWDWGPHPASLFLDLLREPAANITASGNSEHIVFSLSYKNGVVAKAEIGWSGDKKRQLVIKGQKGVIRIDDAKNEQKVTLEVEEKTSHPSYDPMPPLAVELSEFVSALRGGRITSDIKFGVKVTELLADIERRL